MSTPASSGEHHAHGEVANPKALIITFLALTFGVVFVVLVLAVYHNSYTHKLKSINQEGWTADARDTFTARSGSLAHLNSYGSANGVFHIPVDVAAANVVAEYAQIERQGQRGGLTGAPNDAQFGTSNGFNTVISSNIENNVAYADDSEDAATNAINQTQVISAETARGEETTDGQ